MMTNIVSPKRWVIDPGPHAAVVSNYAAEISRVGYSACRINRLIAAARHLCAWLNLVGRRLDGPAEGLVQDFARHNCHCGNLRHVGRRSTTYMYEIERFVLFLIKKGVLSSVRSCDPDDQHVVPYLDWLRQHRGLSEITVHMHRKALRQILPAIGTTPAGWTPSVVRSAVLARRGREGRGGLKRTVTVLRSWLRYHAAMGRCDLGIVTAVPTIAHWKGNHLPRGLKPADVDRLISACDLGCPTGRRDRAILLLLARLGLRAEDVRSLRFEQIDWERGRIALTGKGRRESWLPLPQEVGDALLAWVADGRPLVDDRHVFLRYTAPWQPFTESAAISKIVRRAILRAGLEGVPSHGAHLLRHSMARAALEEGASLEAIGTILRHRSIQTTATYAKVDLEVLKTIAQPWPETASC